MSFFGITALGPPNIFKSSLVNALGKLQVLKTNKNMSIGLTVYSDEEFLNAFNKVDRDNSGFLTSA